MRDTVTLETNPQPRGVDRAELAQALKEVMSSYIPQPIPSATADCMAGDLIKRLDLVLRPQAAIDRFELGRHIGFNEGIQAASRPIGPRSR